MKQQKQKKIILLGAGGREFHNFNVYFRANPQYKVVAFTVTQIPDIERRIYPPKLAGFFYPKGIPIYPERELPYLIKKYKIDEVVFSYSDVSHEYVMHLASLVLAQGADFKLLGLEATTIKSKVPVIAICAIRTGCGKSSVTKRLAVILKNAGKNVAVVRHPMPYGDLERQIVQRFSELSDLDRAECTIEEREEYEPLLQQGLVVYAGVDYEKILRQAEKEANVIIWDGGNNDFPFFKPNLHIVVLDPHRAGDEVSYHPGEVNLRMADVALISKQNTASYESIKEVKENIKTINPKAIIINAYSLMYVDQPSLVANKSVLVVEDGPTITHGGMGFGAGLIAASLPKYKVKKIVNPKKFAKGTILKAFNQYPHIKKVLPALGYSPRQLRDLENTINAVKCDVVVSATPIDLTKILKANKPIVRVRYEVREKGKPDLIDVLKSFQFL